MVSAIFNNDRAQDSINNQIVGISPAIQEIRKLVQLSADTGATVLITGPSGCGKEVIAKSLHTASSRSDKPFIAVNCGAIPRDLIEAELFGHEKGSFTGATTRRLGHFERAQGGTLFLDEIGDMPMDMQVRLLRVLEEKTVRRIGGDQEIDVDTRIVVATHQNLEAAIKNGSFREDLYYRLSVLPIEVSALDERPEDIAALLKHFVSQMRARDSAPLFKPETIHALRKHSWPGNVRELRNVVERASIFFPGTVVEPSHLSILLGKRFTENTARKFPADDIKIVSSSIQDSGFIFSEEPDLQDKCFDMKNYLICEEHSLIRQALHQADGIVSKAAQLVSIPRTTFIEKMRRMDMELA